MNHQRHEVSHVERTTGRRGGGWRSAAALAVTVGVLAGACGGDEDTSPSAEPEPEEPGEETPATTPATTAAPATTDPTTAATAPPTTTAAPTTTLDPAEEAEARSIVDAAFEAYNTGQAATWAEVRDRGSAYAEEQYRIAAISYVTAQTGAEAAADGAIEVVGCTPQGYDRWVGYADNGPVTGYRFECEVIWTDSIRAVAGIELNETIDWIVDEGEVVAVSSYGEPADEDAYFGFFQGFRTWLETKQPDVAEQIEWLIYWGETNYVSADSVPLALEWVDDYVAASA